MTATRFTEHVPSIEQMQSLIDALTTACNSYRKQRRIFRNTHDNLAARFAANVLDLKKHLDNSNLNFRFTLLKCFTASLKELLVEKESNKFIKCIKAVCDEHSEFLATKYLDEMKKIYAEPMGEFKFYLTVSTMVSTQYSVFGWSLFQDVDDALNKKDGEEKLNYPLRH